jgi:hypothetical protein
LLHEDDMHGFQHLSPPRSGLARASSDKLVRVAAFSMVAAGAAVAALPGVALTTGCQNCDDCYVAAALASAS